MQGPPGLDGSVDNDLLLVISFCLLLVGFLLAFAGRLIWRHVMSFVGAVLGGLFGFVYGTAIGGPIVGLVVSILGAAVGSAIFVFLMEAGLGAVAALLTYIVSMMIIDNFLISIAFAGVAFVVTIVFVDQAIGVVTAIIGGLLVGIGLLWMDMFDMTIVAMTMFAVMVFGAALQITMHKNEQMRRSVAASVPATPVAPAAPGADARTCKKCGGPLTYIPEYNRYYCYKCQRYE